MSKKKARRFNPNKSNEALVKSLVQISQRNREMNQEYISKRDTSLLLSSVAIALYRKLESDSHGEKIEQIMALLGEIQEIWDMHLVNGVDICKMCEEET